MNKKTVTNFASSVRMSISQHSPEILTGIGIAGMVTTAIMAVRATPKALRLIDEKKKELNAEESLPKKEVVKTCWKCYIPATVMGTASIACLIGASSVSVKRNAALATAYKLSETALTEYRDKVVETIGEKKEQTIKDAIAKDKVEKNPMDSNTIIVTGHGDTVCLDAITGRHFKSDIEKLKRTENELNSRLLREGYISLNEFYEEIGLERVDIGYELGWRSDRGLMDLHLSAQLDNGVPVMVVGFHVAPKHDYSSAY